MQIGAGFVERVDKFSNLLEAVTAAAEKHEELLSLLAKGLAINTGFDPEDIEKIYLNGGLNLLVETTSNNAKPKADLSSMREAINILRLTKADKLDVTLVRDKLDAFAATSDDKAGKVCWFSLLCVSLMWKVCRRLIALH